jgi:hypothetical protein
LTLVHVLRVAESRDELDELRFVVRRVDLRKDDLEGDEGFVANGLFVEDEKELEDLEEFGGEGLAADEVEEGPEDSGQFD